MDEDVAAVWHTIFNTQYGKWLAEPSLNSNSLLNGSGPNLIARVTAYLYRSGLSRRFSVTVFSVGEFWPLGRE